MIQKVISTGTNFLWLVLKPKDIKLQHFKSLRRPWGHLALSPARYYPMKVFGRMVRKLKRTVFRGGTSKSQDSSKQRATGSIPERPVTN